MVCEVREGVRYKFLVCCLRFLVLVGLGLCMMFVIGWHLVGRLVMYA